jgi:O-antigen/teichoic acid export membrane protein
MSNIGQRVLKNSLFRVGGYAVGALVFFATIVLIARYLGTEDFGQFAFIMAFVGIFQLVADMGVRNIVIRDIALDKANFRRYLGVARTLLWLCSLLSLLGIVGLANLLSLSEAVRQSTYIAGLAVIFIFHGLGYSAVLRAFEEMEWDILGFVLHKVVFIALIWGVTQTAWGLRGVFAAMLLANAGQWLYFWCLVGVRHGRAKLVLDLPAVRTLFVEAFPLGIAEILKRLTRHIDKLLLAALGTPVALGLFSAAYKFLEAMVPFTVNLTLPLFPVFSRLAQETPQRFFKAYEQSLKFLYVMGTPLAVVLCVLAERIVVLCFGEAYREAASTLRILALTVILVLPTSMYGYVFTALGQQRVYMGCVTVALVINAGLALLLIPLYGHLGAALGVFAGEAVLFLCGLIMLQRLGGSLASLRLMARPLLAGLALGLCCWIVRDMPLASMGLGVSSGLVMYACVLGLLHTFTPREQTLLLDAMRVRVGGVTR